MTPQDDWRGLYDEAVRQCNANMNTISELEAARDHLRARLRQLKEEWRDAEAEQDIKRVHWLEVGKSGAVAATHHARRDVYAKCAADLLAVLTESPPQSIRENGPINAIGPALDTKGEMP